MMIKSNISYAEGKDILYGHKKLSSRSSSMGEHHIFIAYQCMSKLEPGGFHMTRYLNHIVWDTRIYLSTLKIIDSLVER